MVFSPCRADHGVSRNVPVLQNTTNADKFLVNWGLVKMKQVINFCGAGRKSLIKKDHLLIDTNFSLTSHKRFASASSFDSSEERFSVKS
jgi:hypothetical protein